MRINQIAAQLYTLRDYARTAEELDATLGKVAAIGYQAVQVSGIGPIAPQTVKELADKHGLSICATHIGYDRFTSNLEGVIADHQLWDCKYAGIGAMPGSFHVQGKAGYIAFAQELSGIAERLQEQGISFVYHNHKFEYERFDGQAGMDWLLQSAGPAFQFELDTYWAQAGGADPAAWIGKLDGRMKVIHLKDMEIVANEQVFAEVGNGNMNWPAILEACRRIGIEWYIVEQDTCRRDPFESLAISYDYLVKMALPEA